MDEQNKWYEIKKRKNIRTLQSLIIPFILLKSKDKFIKKSDLNYQ